MRIRRRWLVNGFILIILGSVALSVRSKREFWPICNYPMFDKVDVHPERDSIEFYILANGEEEEWIHEDASIGRLHHDFALNAILQRDGWPSARAHESFSRVIQEMRKERQPSDLGWAGPLKLRAYTVHYKCTRMGGVSREITGRTLLLEVVDPSP